MQFTTRSLHATTLLLKKICEGDGSPATNFSISSDFSTLKIWRQEHCPICNHIMILPNWPVEITSDIPIEFVIKEAKKFLPKDTVLEVDKNTDNMRELYPDDSCGCTEENLRDTEHLDNPEQIGHI